MNTLQELIQDVRKSKVLSWDLETTSTTSDPNGAKNPTTAKVTHIAMASASTCGCWDMTDEVMDVLVGFLKDPSIYALVFNARYDHAVLHHRGHLNHKDFQAKLIDVLGLVWMIDEEDRHGLKYVVKKYLRIKMIEYADVMQKSPAARKLNEIKQLFAAQDKALKQWHAERAAKRPYPTWADAPMSRPAIRKAVRADNPELKAKEAAAIVEELFEDKHFEEYKAWLEKDRAKHEKKIAKYEVSVNEHMKKYATADAANLIKLYAKVIKLIREENLEHVIEVEMAVRMETIDMEIHGMPIDRDILADIGTRLDAVLDNLEQAVYDHAKREFNINSTPQIREVIFEELGINPPANSIVKGRGIPAFTNAANATIEELKNRGDKRLWQMDCENLDSIPEELRPYLQCNAVTLERLDHPIGQAILDYRTAAKLKGTYIDSFLELGVGDSRIHGGFNCWGTKTGRFSSSSPNLQTLPSRGKGGGYHPSIQKIGPEIREAFVAPPADENSPEGYCLLVTDHSQIELRLIAHFAEEPNLIAVYNESVEVDGLVFYTGDVHQKTADSVGCKRKDAKAVNFGFNYGMGAEKFAIQNRIFLEGTKDYDYQRCAELRTGFFRSYRKIEQFMNYCGQAYKSGERKFPTIAQRWRHFYDGDRTGYNPAKGQILNSMIQGSAGDILKHVIYMIRKYLYPRYPGLQLIGQVHDEIIYVVPNKHAEEIGWLIKYCMEYPWFPISTPVLASAKLSHSWGAKDDDKIPEIGVYYANVDGEDRLFTDENWMEFYEADEAGRVSAKAAAGTLTEAQLEFCRSVVPAEMPKKPIQRVGKKRILSRGEMQKAGML